MFSVWSSCPAGDAATLDYLATYLDVRYEVVRNFDVEDKVTRCQINLTNTGQMDIDGGSVHWSIYLAHMCGIQGIPGSANNETELPNSGFKVTRITFFA